MTVEIRSLNDGEWMLRIYRGNVIYADDARADELIPDGTFGDDLRFVLVDNVEVTENPTTADEIRQAADKNIETRAQGLKLIVAVVACTEVGYRLGRMWEAFAEETGWPTTITRDMAAAEQWIYKTYRKTFGQDLSAIADSGQVVAEMG